MTDGGPGPRITTRVTELLGIEHPIIQEGLGPYKTVQLAAAVTNAGGLGTISMPGMTAGAQGVRDLRAYIEQACELTDGTLAVNIPVGTAKGAEPPELLPFSAAYVGCVIDALRDSAIAQRLRVITTSAGPPGVVRRAIADSGLIHAHKVGGTRQAIRAERDGVDVIIASGYEAGGHTHARPVHTIVLGANVTEAVDVPVVIAGGIRDARGILAALALGADAVAMGTRFVASCDNPDWDDAYAQRVLAMQEGEDVVFPAVFGPSRGLASDGLSELLSFVGSEAMTESELTAWKDDRLIIAQRDGDVTHGIMPCGQVASGIGDLIHVAEFVPGVVAETAALLERLSGLFGGTGRPESDPRTRTRAPS
ncbi:nitronate monooxygenase family protein [Conexibacter sp. DBS9H8]|uniref:NAD(P)H-dependent flavin oxidoreductase n=1 Tax=Conexibacter sp. DBS9H8 TaxID=2937801 RepID=UPI00200D11FE|nr:nitronate monooxygenase [Conexibacter sp. DBS9H8]